MKYELTFANSHLDALQRAARVAGAAALGGHWRRAWLFACIALALSGCSGTRGEQPVKQAAPAPTTQEDTSPSREEERQPPHSDQSAQGMATAGYDVLKA